MSAWMVDKLHIDLMVDVAINGPRGSRAGSSHPVLPMAPNWEHLAETPDELGQMLMTANADSLDYRYPDGEMVPDWARRPYRWERPAYRLDTFQTVKAIACFDYQSCERPDWVSNPVKEWCDRLLHILAMGLPEVDAAPWGFDPENVAKLRAVDSVPAPAP